MVLFPFISRHNDLTYNDLTAIYDENNELIISLLEKASIKLQKLYEAVNEYNILF
jgi:hypothetical protein